MIENFLLVAGQVASLFLMIGAGFTLVKIKKLSENTASQLSFLLMYVVTPSLVIDALQMERDMEMLRGIGMTALSGFIYFTITILITFVLFRRQNADIRAVMRTGVIYPNVGFMGIPLVKSIMGDDIMPYAISFIAVFSLFQWTHAVMTMGGRKQVSLKNALINPGTVGLAVGLTLFLLDLRLPRPVGSALGFISDLNTPLAMIVIGAQMAKADLFKTVKNPLIYYASSLKLIAFPLITAFILLPLKLPAEIYTVVVILSAAPAASMTAMFAQTFKRDYLTAAQFVSLSTLLSIFTLPLFAVLAEFLSSRA